MKKFTNLLIVASLALAGAVMAQEPSPEASQPPGKKTDKKAPAEVKPPKAPHAPKTEAPAAPKTEAPKVKEPAAAAQPPAANEPAVKEPAATKQEKKAPKNKKETPPAAPSTNAEQPAPNAAPTAATTPGATKQNTPRNKKNSKAADANASTSPSATTPAPSPRTKGASKTTASPAPSASAAATAATTPAATTPATTPAASAAATTPPAAATTPPAANTPATTSPAASTGPSVAAVNPNAKKRPDQAKVQQIRQQHASFRAQPKPDRVPAVTFSAGFRLPGVETWSGPRYEVYRSYHPERHDRGWYHSHYQRVELVAGGYYYFNNGYWYPAWGYDSGHEYYAYDAPIYSGKHAEPPDKVIADVQAALQEMGYYKGEVDGLIGPLTREALTGYQRDNGITVTAVIDEPTLDSLGMS